MTRNFGIQSERQRLGGTSALPPTYDASLRGIDPNPYELGAGVLTLMVIAAPLFIVGGIVMFYLAFVY